jgi:hypothetical protein
MPYQSFPGGPRDGSITPYQSTLSGKGNRFVCNNETGYDAWGSMCDIWDQPQYPFVSLKALPIQWEDCSFAYNATSQTTHGFTSSTTLFTKCDFLGGFGFGYGNLNNVSYNRVIYFDECVFDGTKYGTMTGRGTVIANCAFLTPISIHFDSVSAQDWPYGVTLANNVHAGEPHQFTATERTLDDIQEHLVTLDQVYADIAEFREGLGGGGGGEVDPNAAEIERLRGEIADVNAQIGNLQALLQDLQRQLQELGIE